MFKLGKSFTLEDIQLHSQAKPFCLIWIDVSEYKLKIPNENFTHWNERGTQKGYWLGQYLVTQAHWQAIAVPPKENADLKKLNYPASYITWLQAMVYCRLLNLRYKTQIPIGYHFSLPTEAYWRYACQGGYESQCNKISDTELNASSYKEVGMEKTNSWNFYDMQSNVEEWCYDMYVEYSESILSEISNVDIGDCYDAECVRSAKGWGSSNWKEYRPSGRDTFLGGNFTPNGIGFRVCLRPIFDWPNCDLNDPLLIEEGTNMLE